MRKRFYFMLWTACLSINTLDATAQKVKPDQQFAAGDKVYGVLRDYIANMDFKENSLSSGYNETQIGKFKARFLPNAKILDEINPKQDICDRNPTPVYLTIDDYIELLRINFPVGISSRVTKSTIVFDSLSEKKVSVFLEKTITAQYKYTNTFSVKDTIVIQIAFDDDYSSCFISGIEKKGGIVKCINCPCKEVADHPKDKVGKDKVVTETIKAESKPHQAVEVNLGVNIGLPLSNNIVSSPSISDYKYDALINNSSYAKGFKVKPIGLNVSSSVELDIFFTKNIGISTGFYYSFNSSQISVDTLHLRYRSFNSENVPFLRRYTAMDVAEKSSLQSIGVPLLLKAKFPISEKCSFFFSVGGLVTFFNTQTTKSEATVDQEGIYQIRNNRFVYDPAQQVTSTDWILTRDFVSSRGTDANVAAYFEKNKDLYNVALGQNVTVKDKFSYKLGYGGILRLGVSCQLSKKVFFNVGANITGLYINGNDKFGNQLTDKLGEYHSTYYANNHFINLSYFLNLGLQFKLK